MQVAVVQMVSHREPSENLRVISAAVEEAAEAGAQLVLFPEAVMRSFAELDLPPLLADAAEPTSGPWAERIREIARRNDVAVVVGMFTPGTPSADGQPRIKNSLFATGRGVEAVYDKIHLYDAFSFAESDTVEAGREPVTFTLDGVKFGLATCFDLRNPGLFLHYAKQDVDAILVAASWAGGEDKVHHWNTLIAARALDAMCYIVASDQAAPSTVGLPEIDGEPTGIGNSAVIAPGGVTVVAAGAAPIILMAEIDPAATRSARERIPLRCAPVL